VERIHRQSTVAMGAVLAVIGVVMVVRTVAGGGGPFAVGVVVGALLALLGAARVFLATRRPRGRRA